MDALVHIVQDNRLVSDYVYVSAVAILCYDYILSFRTEVTTMWLSPWTYTKVLFLLTRYIPFVECILFLYNQVRLNVNPEVCVRTYPASTWLVLVSMNIAEVVLVIRTWAVWGKDRSVGIGLALLMVVGLIGQCVSMARFTDSLQFASSPIPDYRGCFVVGASDGLIWNYFVMIMIEGFVLILMAISAFRAYRLGSTNRLMHVIHRDGIMFYIYILFVSIANVLIIKFAAHDLLGLFSPMEAVVYSVLTSRIMFNIRETALRDATEMTELHTRFEDNMVFAPPPKEDLEAKTFF